MKLDALVNEGLAKQAEGDVIGAYQFFGMALLKDPDYPQALVNMAALVANRDLIKSQLCLMRRAAEIAPNSYDVQFNLGCALMRAGQYDDALIALRCAVALANKDQARNAYHHLGMVLHDLGRFDAAIEAYTSSITYGWDKELAQDRALALIAKGDLINGFKAFEARWGLIPKNPIWQAGIPLWEGGSLEGKSIVVSHEQGFGDTIQICRLLPRLKELGASWVAFSGPENLATLIRSNFSEVTSSMPDDYHGGTDFHVPAMSLPYRLKIDWPDIDGTPYLKAQPRVIPSRGALKVGVVWAGSAKYVADSARSMSLQDLIPLFDVPSIAFYSLQKGAAEQDLKESGLIGLVADLSSMLTDWQATAEVVAGLDAVVTVDTSVAHLAAALGIPTFTMIPKSCCWRWPREGERTPWYNSMRLMRQETPFEWKSVVINIRNRLIEMKNAKLATKAA